MIHSDPKVQELIKQIHATIRAFGDRHVVYDVVAKLSYYEIVVILHDRRVEFQVSYLTMDYAYWNSVQNSIVLAVMNKFVERTPIVNNDDIKYVLHPGLKLEAM